MWPNQPKPISQNHTQVFVHQHWGKIFTKEIWIERQILEARYETSLDLPNLSPRLILAWTTWIHQSSPHFPHTLVDTLKFYTIGLFSHFSPITKLGSMGNIWIGERIYIQPWEKYFQKKNTHTHTHCEQNFKLSQEEIVNFNMEKFLSKTSQIPNHMYDNFSPHFQHTTCHEDVGGKLDTFLCMI